MDSRQNGIRTSRFLLITDLTSSRWEKGEGWIQARQSPRQKHRAPQCPGSQELGLDERKGSEQKASLRNAILVSPTLSKAMQQAKVNSAPQSLLNRGRHGFL